MCIFGYAIVLMGEKGIFIHRDTLSIPVIASTGALDFLQKSKEQIGVVTSYDRTNGYYGSGGFPPPDTGVCSDVIGRAYRDMGYDLQALLQTDMQKSKTDYKNPGDNNIAFRRVKNLSVYFAHTARSLTTEIIPGDPKNLAEWQPGDIVIFDELPSNHLWHIAIVTDQRRADGVPYIIDNHGYGTSITITPLDWPTRVIGHYRPL